MKKVLSYRGMVVKQVTDGDIKTGDREDFQLNDLEVYNEDGDIEYGGIGSIEEAKEKVDGLISDKKGPDKCHRCGCKLPRNRIGWCKECATELAYENR